VKAAFTRSFNKTVHLTPYSTGAAAKKRGRPAAEADDDDEDMYDEATGVEKRDSGDSDDDIAADRMILVCYGVFLIIITTVHWT